jgi:hypothetical protein
MVNLGRLLRQLYILDEPLLPSEFDQNLFLARATSLGTARTLVSAEAMISTLFPGAPVPVSLTHRLTLLIAWLFFHALL